MPIRRVLANDHVAADRGRVALERGPIVYGAEWPDNPKGQVRNLMLPRNENLVASFKPDLLHGVTVVEGRAIALAFDAQGKVTKTEQEFTAIPYYAWANRGRGTNDGVVPRVGEQRTTGPVSDDRYQRTGDDIGQKPKEREDDQRRGGTGFFE